MIDFEPSEEQQLIVETVRQFARNEVRPAARQADETQKLPSDVLGKAHELGLVANALPSEFGGGGERSAVTGCLIAEELGWADLSLAVAILSPALLAFPLLDFGTPEQQRSYLPALAAQTFAPGSMALVEPRFDFDPFRPLTSARRDGDAYVLDGSKCFVPWLDGGDGTLVVASCDASLAAFWVPRELDGMTSLRERNMGIQALPTVELALNAVRVPATARLGEGREVDLRPLVNRGRVARSALAVGVARAAFEVARDYAKERHAFGVPIATKQAIAFKLADMAIEIDGARLLTWEAARKLDLGEDATREAALASQQTQRLALEVCDGAVQVLGGHGYIREYLPELFLRNARGFASFEALALV